jgi:hypothetical protein
MKIDDDYSASLGTARERDAGAHNQSMITATTLDPAVSEFETQEQAVAYDAWFRAKVQEALDCKEPALPHDAAMAHVDQLIAEKRKQRAPS